MRLVKLSILGDFKGESFLFLDNFSFFSHITDKVKLDSFECENLSYMGLIKKHKVRRFTLIGGITKNSFYEALKLANELQKNTKRLVLFCKEPINNKELFLKTPFIHRICSPTLLISKKTNTNLLKLQNRLQTAWILNLKDELKITDNKLFINQDLLELLKYFNKIPNKRSQK